MKKALSEFNYSLIYKTDGIALFRTFLKTEFSDENIEFWLECEDYKFTSKEIKRQAKAKKIYSDFVAIGSPREVNLEIELRTHTAQKILNPTFDTFDRAQKRIQALMEKDSYPRFLESDLYKKLLASYPPLPAQVNQLQSPPPFSASGHTTFNLLSSTSECSSTALNVNKLSPELLKKSNDPSSSSESSKN